MRDGIGLSVIKSRHMIVCIKWMFIIKQGGTAGILLSRQLCRDRFFYYINRNWKVLYESTHKTMASITLLIETVKHKQL